MKNLLLLTGFGFLCGLAMTQEKNDSIEPQINTVLRPTVFIYLPYSPEITKKLFYDYLKKTAKEKQKKAKDDLLSTNALLAKSNASDTDTHFFIDYWDNQNKNASVIHMKLNSFSQDGNNLDSVGVRLDMQKAKDYLDNFALAIKPYATDKQRKWQQKNLNNSQVKFEALVKEGNKLEKKRKSIKVQMSAYKGNEKDESLIRAKAKNDMEIRGNFSAWNILNDDINQQVAALALLNK